QEKGVDLLLARRLNGVTRAATLQVKYSRAYEGPPGAPYQFTTWFRAFPVPERADFFILASLDPLIDGRGTRTKSSCWLPRRRPLRREEIADLMSSLRTGRERSIACSILASTNQTAWCSHAARLNIAKSARLPLRRGCLC